MTLQQIETALERKPNKDQVFEIKFKTRSPIKGIFIKTPDYTELSRKNLWRIVSENYIAEYKKTSDESLARIFNGVEFTKLMAEES